MDTFFTQKHCDRCGNDLGNTRIMSMFNADCLCESCAEKEKRHPDYAKARDADHDAIASGNYNFPGIGYPGDK